MKRKRPIIIAFLLCSLAILGFFWFRSLGSKEKALEQLVAGKKEMQSESWLSAIHCFDNAIRRDSKLAEAYLLRGTAINEYIVASLSKGKIPTDYSRDDALRDLDKAINLEAASGQAHLQRGYALAGLARTEQAIDAFGQAIPLLKDPTRAYVERAALYFHHSHYKSAVEDMNEAIARNALEPDYYETRSMYRRFAGDFRNSRYDSAKARRLRDHPNKVTLDELKSLEQDAGDYQALSAPQNAPAVIAETKRFQGKWQVVSNDSVGGLIETSQRDYNFTFLADGCTTVLDGKIQQRGKFKLDPGKMPKHIDLEGKIEDRPMTFLGIYEFQPSGLRICISRPGEARPTDFTTEGHIERTIYSLKYLGPEKHPSSK